MTQHTPYDAELAMLVNTSRRLTVDDRIAYAAAQGLRDGYLRAKVEDAALLAAAETLLDARFTGGYCPWCGIAVRIELLSNISGHYKNCALVKAQAAIKQAKEGAA